MKALRSFAVRASLPEELAVLERLALNLRWTWDARTVDLFRWIDADAWERVGHDPMRLLGTVTTERYDELKASRTFMSFLSTVEADLDRYLSEPRWYQEQEQTSPHGLIAYFSPEFGVGEALPIYSGGLGVLAGDHLKAASDLGVPLVAVGLLYRHGYFRQSLNTDGWQQERYPALDPHGMPLTLVTDDSGSPIKVEVDLAGARCVLQLWRAQVGRVPLILLDSDVEENDEDERGVTDRLYGGGSEHRLRQEIVLGIGGVRALQATAHVCDVFHTNEGHAGFLGLERIRQLVAGGSMSFTEALEAVRSATVFTTHTPVPAGIDVYPADLMARYFDSFVKELEITWEEFLSLGSYEAVQTDDAPHATFNMAVMGLRLAARSNGVSKLHGRVSRAIFSQLWPSVAEDEAPIGHITNGVHTSTWIGPEIEEVFDRRLGSGWAEATPPRWDKVEELSDAELWRARERARERLVYMVRERVKAQQIARGASESELGWTDEIFDPGILTIGFARRFAMYKRGTLILSDLDRFKHLLLSQERPMQFVIAGKAHPLDDGGKEMIRQLVHFAADPEVRMRFAFIEDYDMEIARYLCQGADVWLNNPRRPLEACGTSGMKAALNGVLNCSVLDGWWDECFNGRNGWGIGTRHEYLDDHLQDRVEADALYQLLEQDIVPRFYDRTEGPIPRRWVERMKESISSLGGFLTADRMVRDYVQTLYEPARAQGAVLASDDYARARALAEWKVRVRDGWSDVRVIDVDGDATPSKMGERREIMSRVHLGRLTTEDLAVQLAHGPVGANGELVGAEVVEMTADHCTDGTCSYRGSFETNAPGLYGFAIRIVPAHADLTNPMDMGLLTWA